MQSPVQAVQGVRGVQGRRASRLYQGRPEHKITDLHLVCNKGMGMHFVYLNDTSLPLLQLVLEILLLRVVQLVPEKFGHACLGKQQIQFFMVEFAFSQTYTVTHLHVSSNQLPAGRICVIYDTCLLLREHHCWRRTSTPITFSPRKAASPSTCSRKGNQTLKPQINVRKH